MVKDLSITIKPEDEKNTSLINHLICQEIKKTGIQFRKQELISVFQKKSIDARHGHIKLHLKYKVYIGEKPQESENSIPEWKTADPNKRVIVVGSGPAGLLAALKLLEVGIKPVVIERGKKTPERRVDIAQISTKGIVNDDSNYCYGEGGAGTFSDGKLYTRSNKRGNIGGVLNTFVYFGADKKILTDAHPHIGTDRLPQVINNIRNKIIEKGGEVHFDTRLVDFVIEESRENRGSKIVKGIVTKNTQTGQEETFTGDAVILATGHSSSGIYSLISKISPQSLEAKSFAVGVRVEHPREMIDSIQYHGNTENMPAAEYRVVTQIDGRGVYSFCMCPGGFVVPSASEDDGIVVNGMSTAARNSKWSNAAIVVEVRTEDIPQSFVEKARKNGCQALAGLYFRTEIEQKAKEEGKGQAAPAQMMEDFLADKKSEELPKSSYTPGIVSSNLNEWLPEIISSKLHKGFKEINKNMKGFICPQAVLIAPETRTSTPVRILRDKETLECLNLKNLYPAGEGSGYAGGIVSSAMDGIKAAEMIKQRLFNL